MAFLKALAVFLGTVIGVGIFSLPYISMKAGFIPVLFYLAFLSFAVISLHYAYANVVLGTEEKLRLPGYVGKYLGRRAKIFSFFVSGFGLLGALLAYLIVGGEFLNSFLGPYFGGSSNFYLFLFFLPGAILVFTDIKNIAKTEIILLLFLFLILAVFLAKAFNHISIENFLSFNMNSLFLPYGAILFSLWGASIIPELEEIFLSHKKEAAKEVKKTILWGIIISAFCYLLFIAAVLGASGINTSKEAISGLDRILGGVIKLGYVFGVLCCFTSFISIALTLKKVLWLDFKLNERLAFIVSCFLPLILVLLGAKEFVRIISLTGALALGAESCIIIFLYRAFLKKKMNILYYFLLFVFFAGAFFEIFYLLR